MEIENVDIAQEEPSVGETETSQLLHQCQTRRIIQVAFLKSDLTELLRPSSSSSNASRHNSGDLETIMLAPIQRHQRLAMSGLRIHLSHLTRRTRNMLRIGIDRQ